MLKLLIAEDELREATFLQHYIQQNFSDVIELVPVCNDGKTAIEEGLHHKPDIVLLDIEMPKCNGLTVAQKLHLDNPSLHILILTAHGTFEYAKTAISIGVDDYLVKPYTEVELSNALHSIISKVDNQQSKNIHALIKNITEAPQNTHTHPVVRMSIRYIGEHFHEKISLESLAIELGFSSGYVSKCLRKYCNKNFPTLLLEHRIQQSVRLLTESNLTVSEVAYQVGFSDPNYFYKCFQKMMGVQPKKLVKTIRSGR